MFRCHSCKVTSNLDLVMQMAVSIKSKQKLWNRSSLKFLCSNGRHTRKIPSESSSLNDPNAEQPIHKVWSRKDDSISTKQSDSPKSSFESADNIKNNTKMAEDSSLKLQQESVLIPSTPIETSLPPKQIHKVSLSHQIEGHVARQLSKHNITPEEQTEWSQKARKLYQNSIKVPSIPTITYPKPFELAALKKIHKLSFKYNTIFEVRDATVPSSSHHPSFSRLAHHRKHMICYTHADVLDEATIKRIANWTKKSWPKADFRFVDTREQRADPAYFQDIREWLINAIQSTGGMNCALTVGMPNVGKSSVLLGLMRPQDSIKTRVGKNKNLKKGPKPSILNVPGHTQELTQYALQDAPRLYCLDVPGIPAPKEYFQDIPESLFKLRAAGIIADHTINNEIIYADESAAKIVLYCMNRDNNFGYVKKLGLTEPTDDLNVCLKMLDSSGEKRLKSIASFLKLLRTGNFGPVVLDDLSKPWVKWAKKQEYCDDSKDSPQKQGTNKEKEEL